MFKTGENIMKQMLQVMAIVVIFTTAVSTAFQCPTKKIPVSARKKDPTDKTLVTVTITDTNNNEIAQSTFVKNTVGLRVKKLYFCFSDASQTNKVRAHTTLDNVFHLKDDVSSKDGKLGAELIIDTTAKTIDINYKEASKMTATLALPKTSGSWLIVSGNADYNEEKARQLNQEENSNKKGIADWKNISSGKRHSVKIYKNEDIQIYAQQKNKSKLTLITKEAVKIAGSNPVIRIDSNGTASIMRSSDYENLSEQDRVERSVYSFAPDSVSSKQVFCVIPPAAGTLGWLVATGTTSLKPAVAEQRRGSNLLDSGYYGPTQSIELITSTDQLRPLWIYGNKSTRIYARDIHAMANNAGKITDLSKEDIQKAGDTAVIIIDSTGSATIKSMPDLFKNRR